MQAERVQNNFPKIRVISEQEKWNKNGMKME